MRQQGQGQAGASLADPTAGSDSTGAAPAAGSSQGNNAPSRDTATNSQTQESEAERQLSQMATDYRNLQRHDTQVSQRASAADAQIQALSQQIGQLSQHNQALQAQMNASRTAPGDYADMDEPAMARTIAAQGQKVDQLTQLLAQEMQQRENQRIVLTHLVQAQGQQQAAQADQEWQSQVRARYGSLPRDNQDYLIEVLRSGDRLQMMTAIGLADRAVSDAARRESQRQYETQPEVGGSTTTRRRNKDVPRPTGEDVKDLPANLRGEALLKKRIEGLSNIRFNQ